MSSMSNETIVAIVFGIIMTVVSVLAWLDGRRRSRERAPDPENAELTQRVTGVGDIARREIDGRNPESSSEGHAGVRTRLVDHSQPAELEG